jgi:hypothetical protein
MIPVWGIDWGRFIDIDIRSGGTEDETNPDSKKRLQFAYRIDTSAVNPLGKLPASVAANPSSLPQRNLERGWRLQLPSGQAVARAMGVKPLADEEILLGKFLDPAKKPGDPDAPKPILSVVKNPAVFKGNCPLWTYILAEARLHAEQVKLPVKEDKSTMSPRLGPVGGRIVAEVFLGLLFGDANSLLNLDPCWVPKQGAQFALKDFVSYALGR